LKTPRGAPDLRALDGFLESVGDFEASGHRMVHGGTRFRTSVRVDDEVRQAMDEVSDLAPLHNTNGLAALDRVRALRPDPPAVACFDTAFHTTLTPAASLYALPQRWVERFGLRRYGFHGLSHSYTSKRAAEMVGRPADELRIVTCHLGAGASATAVERGLSVDTTMGFTPNDGLVMATRSGSVDPSALLWLARQGDLSPGMIEHDLTRNSGLLGLSGLSGEMPTLLDAASNGHEGASTAIDVYLHRLRAGIAAMATAMQGLDVLAFTGGVGENSATVRERCCRGLAFLGVQLDRERNAAAEPDAEVTADGGGVGVLVIRAREDLAIVRAVEAVAVEGGLDAAVPESRGSPPVAG
jgi:acetate kinase